MPEITVEGGHRLRGTVGVCGAKNAALKEMVAAILAPGRHELTNVPQIDDVSLMGDVLAHLGCHVRRENDSLWLVTPDELIPEAPLELVRQMRASFVVLGPAPGPVRRSQGCPSRGRRPRGPSHRHAHRRPSDRWVPLSGWYMAFSRARSEGGLEGAEVELSFPSVGATENLMLAGVLAKGETSIINAAREPEITDLAEHLVTMGAAITGAGTPIIHIEGTTDLVTSPTPGDPRSSRSRYFRRRRGHHRRRRDRDRLHPDPSPNGTRQTRGGRMRSRARGRLAACPRSRAAETGRLRHPSRIRAFTPTCTRKWWRVLTVAEGTSIVTENLYDARFRYVGRTGPHGGRHQD